MKKKYLLAKAWLYESTLLSHQSLYIYFRIKRPFGSHDFVILLVEIAYWQVDKIWTSFFMLTKYLYPYFQAELAFAQGAGLKGI